MARKVKNVENETQDSRTRNVARNTEKRGNREMHSVGPGVWHDVKPHAVPAPQVSSVFLPCALSSKKNVESWSCGLEMFQNAVSGAEWPILVGALKTRVSADKKGYTHELSAGNKDY